MCDAPDPWSPITRFVHAQRREGGGAGSPCPAGLLAEGGAEEGREGRTELISQLPS